MRRALITGVNGFTGRYLARELEQHGWDVWGLGSHVEPLADNDRFRAVDLLDGAALARWVAEAQPQAVIHLAAIAFVAHGDARAMYDVNVVGTRNLLSAVAALERAPERVLLASSANIYGNSTGGELNESTPANPANDYAVSKLAMEYMAQLWKDRLPITVTRPFNYTGVGQAEQFLLPKIVSHFHRKAEVIELGNMEVWRDFSDVRDVVSAYRRLLDSPSAVGAVVNVCSGRLVSLREVLTLAMKLSGHDIKAVTNPAFVRANEVKTLCGDASRLQSLVGDWSPRPLEQTLEWMLAGNSGEL